jgi:glyoxalase family protein
LPPVLGSGFPHHFERRERALPEITGIHHVTAIAGPAQENLEFYSGALGMRLVKKSVNQDVPDTYHLFYADAEGHPGTDLTFFPWPDLPPVKPGIGLGVEISLAIPAGSLEFWRERLERHGIRPAPAEVRRGARALPFVDPHGQSLALVETAAPREFSAWDGSPVPVEHQIRGLDAVRLWEREVAPTAAFLTGTLGFRAAGEEAGWHRFELGAGGSGHYVEIAERPGVPRGAWGVGGMHHVAWRVADDAALLAMRDRVNAARRHPTPVIDRFWFHSVYFLEPGGVLFEMATDGPGFTADETLGELGEKLVLPPWLEPQRPQIEEALPALSPSARRS